MIDRLLFVSSAVLTIIGLLLMCGCETPQPTSQPGSPPSAIAAIRSAQAEAQGVADPMIGSPTKPCATGVLATPSADYNVVNGVVVSKR